MTGRAARPVLTKDRDRKRLKHQARRDTKPELELRKKLHGRGLRYRVDFAPIDATRSRADIVFTRARVAVFVDGCFWHSCPDHGTTPKNNRDWWQQKLDANVQRDRAADKAFRRAGWVVVRVWEHEDPAIAADRICEALDVQASSSERS